jgi:hypothetical protein
MSNRQSESCYDEHVLRSPVIALLPWRFYHHAIPKKLSGAVLRLPSIPHKLLHRPGLAEPTEFSRIFLADFRPAIYRAGGFSLFDSPPTN